MFHPACGRSAADLGFGEAGERWALFLILSCDALLPFTQRLFARCAVSRGLSLLLPGAALILWSGLTNSSNSIYNAVT